MTPFTSCLPPLRPPRCTSDHRQVASSQALPLHQLLGQVNLQIQNPKPLTREKSSREDHQGYQGQLHCMVHRKSKILTPKS
jgi:hypothetical protein